jgi:membrane-bound serine protease (ClpP class)
MIAGLTLSLVDNISFRFEGMQGIHEVARAFFTVVVSVFITFILALLGSKRFAHSKRIAGLSLDSVQDSSRGFVSIDLTQKEVIGKTGIAQTVLRPSGRIEVDGRIFDAKAEIGYIEKGEAVKVIRDEAGQLYVVRNKE